MRRIAEDKYLSCEWEEVDEESEGNTAGFLLKEYQSAYGAGWILRIRRVKENADDVSSGKSQ